MAEKLAELLHAAMKIDADGAVREAGARGDFRAGHAFDEAKNERFAISTRQRADGLKHQVRFGLIRAIGWMDCFLTFMKFLVELVGRPRLAVEIDSAIASDGGEPTAEAGSVAERVEAGKRLEENILQEVVHGRVRDSGEKDAVDHAGITGIKNPESVAVAVLCGVDERDVGAAGLGG